MNFNKQEGKQTEDCEWSFGSETFFVNLVWMYNIFDENAKIHIFITKWLIFFFNFIHTFQQDYSHLEFPIVIPHICVKFQLFVNIEELDQTRFDSLYFDRCYQSEFCLECYDEKLPTFSAIQWYSNLFVLLYFTSECYGINCAIHTFSQLDKQINSSVCKYILVDYQISMNKRHLFPIHSLSFEMLAYDATTNICFRQYSSPHNNHIFFLFNQNRVTRAPIAKYIVIIRNTRVLSSYAHKPLPKVQVQSNCAKRSNHCLPFEHNHFFPY